MGLAYIPPGRQLKSNISHNAVSGTMAGRPTAHVTVRIRGIERDFRFYCNERTTLMLLTKWGYDVNDPHRTHKGA